MKRTFSLIASGSAIALIGGSLAASLAPVAAAAAAPTQSCYKQPNGAKVCVTVTPPTPAPTPTPRIVTRVVTKVVTVPVKVPVIQRVTVIKTVRVVQRVAEQATTGYPTGGRRLSNGFYQFPADGRSYEVGCNPYAFCLFLFPKGAKIQARAVQDAAHWDVPFTTYGPDGRALIAVKVKSTEPFEYPGHTPHDIRTQLVVTTDASKWPYIISLHTTTKAPSGGTKVAFVDAAIADDLAPRAPSRRNSSTANAPAWRVAPSVAQATPMPASTPVPAPRPVAIAAPISTVPAAPAPAPVQIVSAPTPTPPPPPPPQPTLPPVAAPCSLEGPAMYYIRGTADFTPTNVFDDTQGHTCIAFPHSVQSAPVVLKASADGEDVVNYYSWSAGVFVAGTPDVLILQDGSGKGSQRIYIVKDKARSTAQNRR